MKCAHCKAWSFCLETRTRKNGDRARRYECANGHRFSTLEKIVESKK
jgi:transcriptional regulator NrdR family protein